MGLFGALKRQSAFKPAFETELIAFYDEVGQAFAGGYSRFQERIRELAKAQGLSDFDLEYFLKLAENEVTDRRSKVSDVWFKFLKEVTTAAKASRT
jgi:hypothetical protein